MHGELVRVPFAFEPFSLLGLYVVFRLIQYYTTRNRTPTPRQPKSPSAPPAAPSLFFKGTTPSLASLPDSVPEDLGDLPLQAADPHTPLEHLATLAKHPRLAPMVASNPAAPPALLDTLSTSWDGAVLEAVIANPNAWLTTLLRLAPNYPAAFFANPVVPLLLFEQPDILLQYSGTTLGPLVQQADASVAFLSLLANHPEEEIALAASMHVNLAGELAPDQWEHEADLAVSRIHPRVTAEPLLQALSAGLVASWLLPPLILHGDVRLRAAVSRSPGTPRALLARFRAAGARADLVGYAIPHPDADASLLELLCSGSSWARGLAARHLAADVNYLARLATDREAEVRCWVARNPMAPLSLLTNLGRDSHPAVRYWVARHIQTPVEILHMLGRDTDSRVRSAVACNPSTPADTLLSLAEDVAWQVRRLVARHPTLPEEALGRLARDPEPFVQYTVARRLDLPDVLRGHLANAVDPVVRALSARGVARTDALRADVASASAQGAPVQSTPSRQQGSPRHELTKQSETGATPEHMMEQLLINLLVGVRHDPLCHAIVLAHPLTAPARLTEYIHGAWICRFAAVRNPRAPMDLLRIFAHDTNRVVRASAQARLSSIANEVHP